MHLLPSERYTLKWHVISLVFLSPSVLVVCLAHIPFLTSMSHARMLFSFSLFPWGGLNYLKRSLPNLLRSTDIFYFFRRHTIYVMLRNAICRQSANVGDNDLAVKSSSCHFAERRQPLSPVVDDGVKGRTTRRRTGRTACVSVTTPSAVDEPPCRPAAAADRPSPGDTSMMDIDDADDNDQLIGDFSRPCSLPVLDGKHADLPSISPDTVTLHLSLTHIYDFFCMLFVLKHFTPSLSLASRFSKKSKLYLLFSIFLHLKSRRKDSPFYRESTG